MTPYSLAFYLDVVTTGTVLGLRHTDAPGRVAEVLGPDFGENLFSEHSLGYSYALPEFFWDRASGDAPWTGHHFTLQVHRLAHRSRDHVDEAIRARYGRFAPRLRFEKLRRLLERRGVPLVEVPDPWNAPHYRMFWQPESQVSVCVVSCYGEFLTPDRLRVGDVYHIQAPMTAEQVEARRARATAQGLGNSG
ncbi:hypothetical protein [Streptomyces sp. NPDC052496]|uniref:hypothetical protein n=1 Tax=Streptomyces sp. NPDC052496 TaxID=3154951 RepID=UPI0034228A64